MLYIFIYRNLLKLFISDIMCVFSFAMCLISILLIVFFLGIINNVYLFDYNLKLS